MTPEFVFQVAKQYIKSELNLTPTDGKLRMFSEDRVKAKIVEFGTLEGSTIEVRIRPRVGKIFSKTVDAGGHATFHNCEFRILSVSDLWDETGKPRIN